ncbi:MAG: sulfatase-like hydrolase/transferase [Acidobacteriota bacterium]|nr:sulfatase-like hydrolase/transferase [Acidobacteriota bacterium]
MLSRRELLAGAPAAAFSTPQAPRQSKRPPNFIVFLTDDHGFADLGCQGSNDLKTPNLDALAASGARFTNWYANAPVCAPSRASLLTGRYPIRAGVPNNGQPLKSSELTLAALLKTAGYRTGIFGKWHLGSTPDTVPNAHGFDQFFGFHSGCVDFFSHRYYWGEPKTVNYHDLWRNRTEVFEDGQYLTELITREAKNFVQQNRDRPFFLYLPYNAVHYPMHAPRKYIERFPNLDRERQTYAAMLSAMDDGVGEIMTLVEQLGMRENTFVHYQADNGATRETRAGLDGKPPTAGHNGILRGNKFSLFDGGMHVPAIMSWPGTIPPNQVISEVGMSMDLLPTFCRLAGVSPPAGRTIDGRDILPVAASRAKSPHEAVYWANAGQLAARQGKWKLVMNGIPFDGTPAGREPMKGGDSIFLSNLDIDPGETANRRREQPGVVDELATKAHEWLDDVKKM